MFGYKSFKKTLLFVFLMSCILFTTGNVYDLGFFSKKKMVLGFDLRGGSQLLLDVDFDHYLREQLNGTRLYFKDYFLEKKIKAAPKVSDGMLEIVYRDEKFVDKIEKGIGKNFSVERQEKRFILTFEKSYIDELKRKVISQTIEIIRKRASKSGVKNVIVQKEGSDKILVQVAEFSDLGELKKILEKTAKLTFHLMDEDGAGDSVVLLKDVKDTYELPVGEKLSLDGDLLTDAAVVYNNGKPVINFKFNSVGAKKFAEITKDNIGRVLVMVLDNKVVAAPRINGRIDGGSGTIVGNFTDKEATEIVMLLKIGSLIAPISVVEEKIINIPPGRDLIRKRIHICAIGFALVFGLVFVIYGSLGMFLCATLIISIFVQIALLTLFSVILTLTGMVSLLLSTGISIGTTIVIFEKIKKECKNNKNISVAGIVKNSFDKAYATIFNLHAIITTGAIILYIFNINSTRDLATILMWGIVSSLISNLVYLRTILDMFYSNKKRGEI